MKNQTAQIFNYQGNVEFLGAAVEVQLQSVFQGMAKMYLIEQSLLSAYDEFDSLASTSSD